jgi:hypothetical protein
MSYIQTASGVQVQANAYWRTANHAPPPAYDPNARYLYPVANRARTTQANQVPAPKSVPPCSDVSKALLGKQRQGRSVVIRYPIAATLATDEHGAQTPALPPTDLNGSANPITRFNALNDVLDNPRMGTQMASAPWGLWIRGLGH